MESGSGCGRIMTGPFLLPRAARRRAFWPRELRRGALLLGVSAALFWSSFALGRWIVFFPESGPIYVVPILALHGVLFGRVAWYLESRSRRIADAGAMLLFAVAAATTAVILQNPGETAFVRSWSVGQGLLPAAALGGYVLIALGITASSTAPFARVPSWTPRRTRW